MPDSSPNASSPLQRRVRTVLGAHDLRPRKRLGQNFLVDAAAAAAIVAAAEAGPGVSVFEIGAGVGSLTAGLLRAGASVCAVEIDRRLEPALRDLLESDGLGPAPERLRLLWADVLKLDLEEVFGSGARWTVVGNVPYHVTTPILGRLFDFRLPIARLVLTVQSEVAARLVAEPGTADYGSLTVWRTHYADECRIVRRLKPGAFVPRPRVDSAVVRIDPRPAPPALADERLFFAVVRSAFGQRRKTLLNALAGSPHLATDKDQARAACQASGIDPADRGETLSFADFATLADALAREGASPS